MRHITLIPKNNTISVVDRYEETIDGEIHRYAKINDRGTIRNLFVGKSAA